MHRDEAIRLATSELATEGEEVLDATPSGASIVAFLHGPDGFVIAAARTQVLTGKARPMEGEPFRVNFDHQALAESRYEQILRDLG